MKVAFTIGAINRGGAETLLLDVMKRASQLPFEAMLIHRNGGDYEVDFKETGQPCVHLCPRHHRYISYVLALRKILRENKIDIVHAQCWLDAIYARIATIGLPIKIVTTFHGFTGAIPTIGWLCKIRYVLSIIASDKVCFVSEHEQQGFERNFGKWIGNKGCVVYNGVDFGKLDNISKNAPLSTSNSPHPKLCMVGNFNSVRSQMVVCQALAQVQFPYNFYFIGGRIANEAWRYDNCVAYCQEHHLDNVHFFGKRGDVPVLLQQMDGFVYSSANDTFGIALVEAMAIGLPVVTNDHPVMQEVTNNGKWATLFKSDDIAACANAIEDLLLHLAERKATAKNTAKQVREEYSIEKHIERLTNVYQSLLQRQE